MSALPKLNFPAIRLRARRREGQVEVWDDLRGIYLVLTPEEWVRRHLIAYLVSHCGVLPKRVVQEYAVPVNGQPQRADVVVVGDRAEPLVLAECKAPEIRIGERTLAQAVRYNSVLGGAVRDPDQRPAALLLRVPRRQIRPVVGIPRFLGPINS